ncbi:MAG: hypothetical protein GVY18_18805, partial [Bacteroidetes bacterium]|nr:hypothetical protein [Bacteroidota bacterium]
MLTRCLIIALAAVTLAACDPGDRAEAADADAATTPPDTTPNVVEITAIGLDFEAPDTIPSGWTTFRLKNASEMVHFALIARYPGDRGVDAHQNAVAPV